MMDAENIRDIYSDIYADPITAYAKAVNPHWSMTIKALPEHVHLGLVLYVLVGVEPGSFLYGVLTNNFTQAVCAADQTNQQRLNEWALAMINAVPTDAWGSAEKVEAWIGQGGILRCTS